MKFHTTTCPSGERTRSLPKCQHDVNKTAVSYVSQETLPCHLGNIRRYFAMDIQRESILYSFHRGHGKRCHAQALSDYETFHESDT